MRSPAKFFISIVIFVLSAMFVSCGDKTDHSRLEDNAHLSSGYGTILEIHMEESEIVVKLTDADGCSEDKEQRTLDCSRMASEKCNELNRFEIGDEIGFEYFRSDITEDQVKVWSIYDRAGAKYGNPACFSVRRKRADLQLTCSAGI